MKNIPGALFLMHLYLVEIDQCNNENKIRFVDMLEKDYFAMRLDNAASRLMDWVMYSPLRKTLMEEIVNFYGL